MSQEENNNNGSIPINDGYIPKPSERHGYQPTSNIGNPQSGHQPTHNTGGNNSTNIPKPPPSEE